MGMIFNTGRMQQIAKTLITDAGAPVNFRHNLAGAYDPSTGKVTNTSTTYQFQTAKFNYVLRDSGESSGRMLIEMNDKKLIVLPRADGVKPAVSDWQVEIDGDWWTIVTIRSVAPAGVDIYYEIQCRLK